LAFWQAQKGIASRESRCWNGRYPEATRYRYIHDVFVRGGDDTLAVQWFEMTVVNAKMGKGEGSQMSHRAQASGRGERTPGTGRAG